MARSLSGGLPGLIRSRNAAVPPVLSRLSPPLVWLHSDHARGAKRLEALSEVLLQDGSGGAVLLTYPEDMDPIADLPGRVALPLSADDAGFARMLVARCAPAAFLSTARTIPAGIIAALRASGARICLAENAVPRFATRWRALPGFSRPALADVHRVFLPREEARIDWQGHGLRDDALVVSGRLSAIPVALGCNEAEREAVAEAFRNRTLWFACHVPEREEELVIAAHREALRDSHRLALILHPADQLRGGVLKAALGARFSTALRSEDDPITTETQIYIVDTESERGLWYRLAVACYIGGSMGGDGAQVSPMEAAALGCAIVHGRMFGRFSEPFDLLRQARATRMVQGGEALGPAIGGALRPEQAADMAHRGWQVIAEGAEATEIVMAELLDAIAASGRA